MYSVFRKCIFTFDAEKAKNISLYSLKLMHNIGLTKCFSKPLPTFQNIMGLTFPNKLGLAAGLDKNAEYIDSLASLGFGFIEIGSVTPLPQEGNPKPRIFRLPQDEAVINRMGFNSKGADYVAQQLEKTKYKGILGINLGKNLNTPIEKAADDYIIGFQKLWKYASYITINISSPNTKNLRELQQADALSDLIVRLQRDRDLVFSNFKKYLPLVFKISPDISDDELIVIANTLNKYKVDGAIATNTTLARDNLTDLVNAEQAGGLSGKPLTNLSTRIIKQLRAALDASIPIIASGGVMDKNSANEKIRAGASLVQVYTGLVYKGPSLIKEILEN